MPLPRWRNGYAVDCRSTPSRFDSGFRLSMKEEIQKTFEALFALEDIREVLRETLPTGPDPAEEQAIRGGCRPGPGRPRRPGGRDGLSAGHEDHRQPRYPEPGRGIYQHPADPGCRPLIAFDKEDVVRHAHPPPPRSRRSVRSKRWRWMPETRECCLFKYMNDRRRLYLRDGYTVISPGRSGTPRSSG